MQKKKTNKDFGEELVAFDLNKSLKKKNCVVDCDLFFFVL